MLRQHVVVNVKNLLSALYPYEKQAAMHRHLIEHTYKGCGVIEHHTYEYSILCVSVGGEDYALHIADRAEWIEHAPAGPPLFNVVRARKITGNAVNTLRNGIRREIHNLGKLVGSKLLGLEIEGLWNDIEYHKLNKTPVHNYLVEKQGKLVEQARSNNITTLYVPAVHGEKIRQELKMMDCHVPANVHTDTVIDDYHWDLLEQLTMGMLRGNNRIQYYGIRPHTLAEQRAWKHAYIINSRTNNKDTLQRSLEVVENIKHKLKQLPKHPDNLQITPEQAGWIYNATYDKYIKFGELCEIEGDGITHKHVCIDCGHAYTHKHGSKAPVKPNHPQFWDDCDHCRVSRTKHQRLEIDNIDWETKMVITQEPHNGLSLVYMADWISDNKISFNSLRNLWVVMPILELVDGNYYTTWNEPVKLTETAIQLYHKGYILLENGNVLQVTNSHNIPHGCIMYLEIKHQLQIYHYPPINSVRSKLVTIKVPRLKLQPGNIVRGKMLEHKLLTVDRTLLNNMMLRAFRANVTFNDEQIYCRMQLATRRYTSVTSFPRFTQEAATAVDIVLAAWVLAYPMATSARHYGKYQGHDNAIGVTKTMVNTTREYFGEIANALLASGIELLGLDKPTPEIIDAVRDELPQSLSSTLDTEYAKMMYVEVLQQYRQRYGATDNMIPVQGELVSKAPFKKSLVALMKPTQAVTYEKSTTVRKVLFITIGSTGDVLPASILARELSRVVEQVHFICPTSERAKPYMYDLPENMTIYHGDFVIEESLKTLTEFDTRLGTFITDVKNTFKQQLNYGNLVDMLKLIQGVDLVIGSCITPQGATVAEILQANYVELNMMPWFTDIPSSLKSSTVKKIFRPIVNATHLPGVNELREKYNLKPLSLGDVITMKQCSVFAIDQHLLDVRAKSYKAQIPALTPEPVQPKWPLALPEGPERHRIIVTFGSMPHSWLVGHSYRIMDALLKFDNVQVLWITGALHQQIQEDPRFDNVNKDTRVYVTRHINHGEVVPLAKIIYHHGGAGTTQQASRNGVVSVITPVAFDQPIWADVVVRRGVGLRLDKHGDIAHSYHEGLKLSHTLQTSPSFTMSNREACWWFIKHTGKMLNVTYEGGGPAATPSPLNMRYDTLVELPSEIIQDVQSRIKLAKEALTSPDIMWFEEPIAVYRDCCDKDHPPEWAVAYVNAVVLVVPAARGKAVLNYSTWSHTAIQPVLPFDTNRGPPLQATYPLHAHGEVILDRDATSKRLEIHVPAGKEQIIDVEKWFNQSAENARRRVSGGREKPSVKKCDGCGSQAWVSENDFCPSCIAVLEYMQDSPIMREHQERMAVYLSKKPNLQLGSTTLEHTHAPTEEIAIGEYKGPVPDHYTTFNPKGKGLCLSECLMHFLVESGRSPSLMEAGRNLLLTSLGYLPDIRVLRIIGLELKANMLIIDNTGSTLLQYNKEWDLLTIKVTTGLVSHAELAQCHELWNHLKTMKLVHVPHHNQVVLRTCSDGRHLHSKENVYCENGITKDDVGDYLSAVEDLIHMDMAEAREVNLDTLHRNKSSASKNKINYGIRNAVYRIKNGNWAKVVARKQNLIGVNVVGLAKNAYLAHLESKQQVGELFLMCTTRGPKVCMSTHDVDGNLVLVVSGDATYSIPVGDAVPLSCRLIGADNIKILNLSDNTQQTAVDHLTERILMQLETTKLHLTIRAPNASTIYVSQFDGRKHHHNDEYQYIMDRYSAGAHVVRVPDLIEVSATDYYWDINKPIMRSWGVEGDCILIHTVMNSYARTAVAYLNNDLPTLVLSNTHAETDFATGRWPIDTLKRFSDWVLGYVHLVGNVWDIIDILPEERLDGNKMYVNPLKHLEVIHNQMFKHHNIDRLVQTIRSGEAIPITASELVMTQGLSLTCLKLAFEAMTLNMLDMLEKNLITKIISPEDITHDSLYNFFSQFRELDVVFTTFRVDIGRLSTSSGVRLLANHGWCLTAENILVNNQIGISAQVIDVTGGNNERMFWTNTVAYTKNPEEDEDRPEFHGSDSWWKKNQDSAPDKDKQLDLSVINIDGMFHNYTSNYNDDLLGATLHAGPRDMILYYDAVPTTGGTAESIQPDIKHTVMDIHDHRDYTHWNTRIAPLEGVMTDSERVIKYMKVGKTFLTKYPEMVRPVHTKGPNQTFNATSSRLHSVKHIRKYTPNPMEEVKRLEITYFDEETGPRYKFFQDNPLTIDTEGTKKWILKHGKSSKVKDELLGLMQDGWSRNAINKVRVHAKLETLIKESMEETYANQNKVRIIVWQSYAIASIFSPMFKVVKQRLKSMLSNKYLYTDGLRPDEIASRLRHVKQGCWIMESDLEQQDRQTDAPIIAAEMELYRRLGVMPETLDLWRKTHEDWFYKGSSIKGRRDQMRLSGQATTSIGNTITNMLVHSRILLANKEHVQLGMFLGDDIIVLSDTRMDSTTQKQISKDYYNMVDNCLHSQTHGSYLQMVVSPTGDGSMCITPDIKRMRYKYEMTNGVAKASDENMTARAMSYLMMLGKNEQTDAIIKRKNYTIEPLPWNDIHIAIQASALRHGVSFEEVNNDYNLLLKMIENPQYEVREYEYGVHQRGMHQ